MDNIEIVLYSSAFIFIFTFVFRSSYRIIFPQLNDFDNYYHLFFAHLIRENKHRIPEKHSRLIEPARYAYPFFFHFLISLFPEKIDRLVEKLLNPFLDAAFTALIFIAALFITESTDQALSVSLMYIFTPLLFSVQSLGPRVKSITPRLLGELLVNLVFMAEYFYILTNNILFLGVAVLLSSLVVITSKFSIQALIFISFLMMIFTFKLFFILIPFTSVILVLALVRDKYYSVIKNHVLHLVWYFKNNLQGKMYVSDRNSLKKLVQAFRNLSLEEIHTQLFKKNSLLIIIIKFPLFFVVLWNIIKQIRADELINYPEFFIISGFIIYLITSTKLFLFIGEAERYLNHVIFFIFLYLSYFIDNEIIFYCLVPYGIFFYILDIVFLNIKNKKKDKDSEEVISYLKSKQQAYNIATIPFHLGMGWRILYETHHNWLYPSYFDEKTRKKWDKILYHYPILDVSKLPKIISLYNLHIIFIKKKTLMAYFKDIPIPEGFTSFDLNPNIVVVEMVKK